VLTLVLDVNIHNAVAASITSVIATSSGAAAFYVRSQISNLRLAMFPGDRYGGRRVERAFLGRPLFTNEMADSMML
jgi:hypothetical protein